MKRLSAVQLLLKRKLAADQADAEEIIASKRCFVDGAVVLNPNRQVTVNAHIVVEHGARVASRAGGKLAGALEAFGVSPSGRICADLGSSTGGFTEVLLNEGAAKVYAVDTAKGELVWKLRQNSKVVVWEGKNAAHLESFPEPVSFVTIDISLVSLRDILPNVLRLTPKGTIVLALIKPQYEIPESEVPQGGVLADSRLEKKGCILVAEEAERIGFRVLGIMRSAVTGKSGNQEYPLLLER